MNKSLILYFNDLLMGIAFLVCAVTGLIKIPFLVRAFSLNHKLPMILIRNIHDWSGVILVILVVIHLVLHWKWIMCMTKNIFKKSDRKCER